MSDEIRINMQVKVNGKTSSVNLVRPLHLSGDSRRHRAQLRALAAENVESLLTVLGGQFTAEATEAK